MNYVLKYSLLKLSIKPQVPYDPHPDCSGLCCATACSSRFSFREHVSPHRSPTGSPIRSSRGLQLSLYRLKVRLQKTFAPFISECALPSLAPQCSACGLPRSCDRRQALPRGVGVLHSGKSWCAKEAWEKGEWKTVDGPLRGPFWRSTSNLP